VNNAAKQETHSHDKKKVRKNTAKHRGLDKLNFVSLESNNADNQFDGVSESCVEQATQGVTKLQGEFFGRKRQDSGEWNNSEEVDGEDGSGTPTHLTSDDAERHHNQKKVDIVYSTVLDGYAHEYGGVQTYC
jgi:hypothetical protein